jgi:hypothetical protein
LRCPFFLLPTTGPERLLMKIWFDSETVISPLEAFAKLPDWLAAGMDGERVEESLQRYVPEFIEGRPRLLSCTPERLRAKGDEWLARYQLSVAGPGAETRSVVAVGNLYGPLLLCRPGHGISTTAGFGERRT